MSAMASQITSLTIVYSMVYSGADQRKHQSPTSLASVWGIQRWPVNYLHKGTVTRKMFPLDDVIMDLPFVRRIHRSPVNSPHKGQWHRALMFSLICTWTNGWVNNRYTGDFRRHRAYYDATSMSTVYTIIQIFGTDYQKWKIWCG